MESQQAVDNRPTKSCPACGETILAVAVKCKHCGERLGSTAVSPTSGPLLVPQRSWKAVLYTWLGGLLPSAVICFVIAGAIFKSNGGSTPYRGAIIITIIAAPLLSLPAGVGVGIPFMFLYPAAVVRRWNKRFLAAASFAAAFAYMVTWTVAESLMIEAMAQYPSTLRFDESKKYADLFFFMCLAAGAGAVMLAARKLPKKSADELSAEADNPVAEVRAGLCPECQLKAGDHASWCSQAQ